MQALWSAVVYSDYTGVLCRMRSKACQIAGMLPYEREIDETLQNPTRMESHHKHTHTKKSSDLVTRGQSSRVLVRAKGLQFTFLMGAVVFCSIKLTTFDTVKGLIGVGQKELQRIIDENRANLVV